MDANKMREYGTTVGDCGCPAFRFRRGPCKHVLALRAAIALALAAGYRVGGRTWKNESL